jgi:hypothetical protein
MEYHIYGVDTAFVSSDQTVVGSNPAGKRQVAPPGAPDIGDTSLSTAIYSSKTDRDQHLKHNQDEPRKSSGEK